MFSGYRSTQQTAIEKQTYGYFLQQLFKGNGFLLSSQPLPSSQIHHL